MQLVCYNFPLRIALCHGFPISQIHKRKPTALLPAAVNPQRKKTEPRGANVAKQFF
jgi:hypothetical protein